MRTLLIAVLILAVSACTPATESTVGAESVSRSACEVRLPADWKRALTDSRVDTGGGAEPLAIGSGGEVVAARGDDVLLIQPDKTVTTVYSVPDAEREAPEVAAINDRWIAVGILRTEGHTVIDGESYEYAARTLKRIDVIDRRDDSVRTVFETPEADLRVGRNPIDSVAVFDDSVYWITRDEFTGDHGTLRAYDANSGTTRQVEIGDMRDLSATATGIVWTSNHPEPRPVFRGLAPLPDAIASVTGINDDQTSLVRDGDAYAWMTGVAEGGTGIARWSPETGITRISTVRLFEGAPVTQPTVELIGPYVVVGAGQWIDSSTLIDTRSGALTRLGPTAFGAAGGSIVTDLTDDNRTQPPVVGLVRADQLSPLACSATGSDGDTVRPSCEVALPAAWRTAFADSAVDTGGSTTPLAVGRGGEIAAGYDDGDTRRLLLIGEDESVKTVYRVADAAVESIGFAAIDERRIVVGVDTGPRRTDNGHPHLDDNDDVTATNPSLPWLTRIDVVDRSNNSVRTIMARNAEERVSSTSYRDSLAVFDGTVYWTTRAYPADTVVRSYDLDTGRVAEIAKAPTIEQLRATPLGIAWSEPDRNLNRVEHNVAELPAALQAAGADADAPLATDGTVYAWITDTGVAHWSPDTGVTRIDTLDLLGRDVDRSLHVDGPYVILSLRLHGGGRATVIDTRSGAITSLGTTIVTAGGGSIAVQVPEAEYSSPQAGLVRTADLPPLTCDS